MKRFLIIGFVASILHFNSIAQDIITERVDTSNKKNEHPPYFPGGISAFDDYVTKASKNILKSNHVEGNVKVQIVIDKNGHVTQPKILRGLTPETDSAAIYLLKNSPAWHPGTINGYPFRWFRIVDVKFFTTNRYHAVHVDNVILTPKNRGDVEIDETVPISRESDNNDPNKVYLSVEQQPQFPGGIERFNEYIKKNRKTDIPLSKSDEVIVQFIVEKDGSITNIKIIRGPSESANEDAIRLVKSFPQWIPGMQNGHAVRVYYVVPI